MSRLPSSVPLPEVGNYTDEIVFGNLGLPVGFDQEQLLVNLRGIKRICTVGILGHVSILSGGGEAGELETQITGWDDSGTATLSGLKVKRKEVTTSTNSYWHHPDAWGPDVTIHTNSNEMQARIKDEDARYERGLSDPKAWAKQLNEAVRNGLDQAAYDVTFKLMAGTDEIPKSGIALSFYGVTVAIAMLSAGNLGGFKDGILVSEGLLQGMNYLMLLGAEVSYLKHKPSRPHRPFVEGPHSVCPIVPVDRYLLTNGLVNFSRLIKARK